MYYFFTHGLNDNLILTYLKLYLNERDISLVLQVR